MHRLPYLRVLIAPALLMVMLSLACSSDGELDGAPGVEGAQPAAAAQSASGLMLDTEEYTITQEFPMTIELTSEVFNRIRRIPIEYTCTDNYYYPEAAFAFRYGEDKSPPLAWSNVPDGTVSFAIIFDDPDSVTLEKGIMSPRVHWVIWNIPTDVTALAEHVATTTAVLSIGPNVRQGANDYRGIGYGGPCPPPNIQHITKAVSKQMKGAIALPHKYSFRIYALDTELHLAAGANKNELLEAMDGHILAAGELAGEYVNKILYK